ncbi:MipA/OmpV family protein [Silvimonas iriomotensis]|uniref:MltA-interacting MipA family protein n=1 Tax=Silvimonas iriomotensis TaxID=449662 RepID=A0ABQ2PBV2_9NEIS|nr:MipA/OmpV family protein [Silvimonas iriomotensis]GGP23014.1 MltA-interacting MipA family protein [Silvimonas iriomotensis]
MAIQKTGLRNGWLAPFAMLLATAAVQAATGSAPVAATAATPQDLPDDGLHYSLGFGAFVAPKYSGSSDNHVVPAPLIGVRYDRYFFGTVPDANVPFGIGAYLYRDKTFRVGVALSADLVKPRKSSDDARLTGLPDVERTAHATFFASYNLDWLSVVGSATQDVGGKGQGTTATLDALGRYQVTEQLTLSAGPGVTWGSSKNNQTFYGVTAEDSARSGLAEYTPGAGLAAIRFSVGAMYQLDKNWTLGARIGATRLPGDVGDSPIVEKKNQMTYGVFTNYNF